jgi:hypothetical protein
MNGDLQTDFDRIVAAFSAIAKLKSPLQQAFVLSRTAIYHGFPRAEFKRLFGIWQHEQAQIAAATQEEKAA